MYKRVMGGGRANIICINVCDRGFPGITTHLEGSVVRAQELPLSTNPRESCDNMGYNLALYVPMS